MLRGEETVVAQSGGSCPDAPIVFSGRQQGEESGGRVFYDPGVLFVQGLAYMPWMEGRELPMIDSADFTIPYRDLRSC